MQAFCDAQLGYIEGTVDEARMGHCAAALAREARRRRLQPEVLLMAMELAGCQRSHDVREDDRRSKRYFVCLHQLLSAYFDSSSRPADRRLSPRGHAPRTDAPLDDG
jgi:hypothetical protein